MARRAVLHSALFKNGLSKGSESAPGCKVTARCPGSRELPNMCLRSVGVHRPLPESQSCEHRQTLSVCLEQIAPRP